MPVPPRARYLNYTSVPFVGADRENLLPTEAGTFPFSCLRLKNKEKSFDSPRKARRRFALSSKTLRLFVRIGRIELPSHPWQGRVLPLNHIRNNLRTVYPESGNKTTEPFVGILTLFAPVVKWISRQASNLLLGVRIPPGAHERSE
jgi:hypothetical protein